MHGLLTLSCLRDNRNMHLLCRNCWRRPMQSIKTAYTCVCTIEFSEYVMSTGAGIIYQQAIMGL